MPRTHQFLAFLCKRSQNGKCRIMLLSFPFKMSIFVFILIVVFLQLNLFSVLDEMLFHKSSKLVSKANTMVEFKTSVQSDPKDWNLIALNATTLADPYEFPEEIELTRNKEFIDQVSAFLITMTTSEKSKIGEPLLLLKIEPVDSFYAKVGMRIQILYTVENVGNSQLLIPFRIYDDLISKIQCPIMPISGLAPHNKTQCIGMYVTNQMDVERGVIFHSVYVAAQIGFVKSISPKSVHRIPALQFQSIVLEKPYSTLK
jgi:hypothetical protein